MTRLTSLYRTSVGKKFIASITGLILFLFLIGHMAGNLKSFTGTSDSRVPHIDQYAHFLTVMGEPMIPAMAGLWTARFVLLLCLIFHIVTVTQLAMENAKARPVGYFRSKKIAASLPAQWMLFSGFLILAFIIFHILHFTTGTIRVDDFEHGYVYSNLWHSFAHPLVAIGYTIAMIAIGVHLWHGVWSMFQTWGWDNADRNRELRMFAIIATILIVVGFIAVPLAFLSGVMAQPVQYDHDLLTRR